jgi:hypothetical protein
VGARPIPARSLTVALATAATLLAGLPAQAAEPQRRAPDDPRRWTLSSAKTIPPAYWQGVTPLPNGGLVFSGFVGLFRTDASLRERINVGVVIPQPVVDAEGYNHVGDLSYDRAEGGRLLLPLECYTPGQPNGGNTCGTGSFGVADPRTLAWRYHVKLDPAFIQKAMWVEASPDGRSLWTQAGPDLLRYRAADVHAGQTQPIRPVQRLKGAANLGQYTGATFHRGRLFAAIGRERALQVWSIDVRTGRRRLEISRRIRGESEGLATVDNRLHWTIMPAAPGGTTPTYGAGKGAMLTFGRAPARARAPR